MKDMHLYVTDEFYDWVRQEAFEAKTSMSRLMVGVIRGKVKEGMGTVVVEPGCHCGFTGQAGMVRAIGRHHAPKCRLWSTAEVAPLFGSS